MAIALHVSAWIEIGNDGGKGRDRGNRTPCECVD